MIPHDGLSNPAWHLTIEVASVVLAAVLGALALARFYARRQRIFVFIGTGFLATGVLDAVHAFVSSDLLGGSGIAVSTDVSAWTWLQARVFLSLFLALSAFGALDDDSPEIRETRVYTAALVLTGAVLLVFGLAPTPQAVHPGWFLPRPGEILPAVLFGVASVGYLRRGRWRTDAFEYWLILGLAIAAVAHLAFMSRSIGLYDPFFDAGHLLKLTSYIAVGTGLVASMHSTFRREEEALRIGAVANETLAYEVAVRRQAESVLQRSEERLQGFLDSAHDLIQSTSPEGRIVYVNRAWERALGYDRSEMYDMELASLLHPRCRCRVHHQGWTSRGLRRPSLTSPGRRDTRRDPGDLPRCDRTEGRGAGIGRLEGQRAGPGGKHR
jgi:PAS domain S-box-containing protein